MGLPCPALPTTIGGRRRSDVTAYAGRSGSNPAKSAGTRTLNRQEWSTTGRGATVTGTTMHQDLLRI
jgi:hypothetical protein